VRRSSELVLAFLAVAVITALYAGIVATSGVPGASGLLGHGIGVMGFTLMLLTEVAYSFRKRAMRRPRGTMRSWLRFHIFTGIVGPYLVFLHAAWSFNGLAGALTLMTLVVVASGFIGRYIYTAVPRTADGAVVEAMALQAMLDAARREAASGSTPEAAAPPELVQQRRVAGRRLRELERQMAALRWSRRALATWHTIHVPIGMVMFTMAFVHIAAALYYATLLR
jgi:hypothetical protein